MLIPLYNNVINKNKLPSLNHQVSQKAGFLKIQKEAFELLSKIYQANGDFKKAFSSHQQFKTLNDSLNSKEVIEKITQLEYEYIHKQTLDSISNREFELTKEIEDTNHNIR